ncbi:MAG: glucosyl-3-phosphoglycerate synthase [Actinobacteria bacterium]|nr:glucosyl-3-phosphoglycerate synthase [Actinomycetota bacterium]MCL5882959.1 glucosyl-3-phosphoglycerate synthase [Actinomycetota bacterium]
MKLDEWFTRRTYHYTQFADVEELVRLKRQQGLTISVCLPTRNEADTIPYILPVIRRALMERHQLVDQLAVIDSRSTDDTASVAAGLGAEVFFDDEYLTGQPRASGKGEALWKSLVPLTGDIIVWIDSDIRNFSPHFIYGLVGPLLTEPGIGYVKGYYRRPLFLGEMKRETGGGRVTEICARPLLSMFYPELSGLIQPLSGEYAGRRSILESVPFFTGYGVEIGLDIDIFRKFGLEAIAQTDLRRRVHHNQSTVALGRMSFNIMQAVFKRLHDEGRLELRDEPGADYHRIYFRDGNYGIESLETRVIERPPLASLPEYRRLHPQKEEGRL